MNTATCTASPPNNQNTLMRRRNIRPTATDEATTQPKMIQAVRSFGGVCSSLQMSPKAG